MNKCKCSLYAIQSMENEMISLSYPSLLQRGTVACKREKLSYVINCHSNHPVIG